MLLWLCLLRRALIPVLLLAAAAAQAPPAPRITQPVSDRQVVRLAGNTISLAQAANDRGAAAPELALSHMLLVLRPSDRQQADLHQLLDELRENDSPQYHHWLTPAEFGARFGPAPADVATVTAWLAGEGFHIDHIAAGGGTIEFSGTAANVAAAFHTQMRRYQVRGVMHLANASDPSIPQALAPVVAGIVSLNDVQSQPASHVLGEFQVPGPAAGAAPNLNYMQNGVVGHALVPGDLAKIYDSSLSSNPPPGQGETIALVARSDVNPADINAFRSLFGVSSEGQFQMIQVGADPGIASGQNAGDAGEATLDAEWANALAPAANVDLVVAASTNTTDGVDLAAQYIVDHDLAPVMSTSFGQCETLLGAAEDTFWNNLWEQAAAEGITALVSSGDNGAAGCDDPGGGKPASQGLAVSGMASTPYDTAVGGTEFNESGVPGTYWSTSSTSYVTALGYIPEDAWNESSAASGNISLWSGSGGKSIVYAKPPWQAGTGVPADSGRDLPDVSLAAAEHDGYVMCIRNSCQLNNGGFSFAVVSGTSASSPSWAGIMALVGQQENGRVGLANPVLYKLASAGVYHDVTTGSNAVPCLAGSPECTSAGTLGYSAGPGFDLATGWGSPDVGALLQQWSTIKFAATTTTLQLTLPQTLTYGQSVPVSIQVAPVTSGPVPMGEVALLAQDSSGNETALQTFTLDASGTVHTSTDLLPAGTHGIVASYAGDLNYGSSTSTAVNVTGVKATPAATIAFLAVDARGNTTPITQAAAGAEVVATVAVSGSAPDAAPTGTAQITATTPSGNPFLSGPQALDRTGTAYFDSHSTPPGSYVLVGDYAGDGNYNPITSPAGTFTINRATTTLKITQVTASTVWVEMLPANGYFGDLGQLTFEIWNGGTELGATGGGSTGMDAATGQQAYYTGYEFNGPLPGQIATLTARFAGDSDYLPSVSPAYTTPTPPNLTFSPATLDFGVLATGASSTKTVTLTNSGGMAANLQFEYFGLGFSESDNCGGTLAAGAACAVSVTFKPQAGTTSYTGSLMTGQAGDPPLTLSGAAGGVAVSATTIDWTLGAGHPATFQLVINPVNGLSGAVTLGCTGLPGLTSCSFNPASAMLDGSHSVPVTLTVTETPITAQALSLPISPPTWPWWILLAMAGLTGLAFAAALAPQVRRLALFACVMALSACGGGAGISSAGNSTSGGSALNNPPSQAIVELSPATIDFGKVPVSQTGMVRWLTVANNSSVAAGITGISVVPGTGPAGDFAIANNLCGASLPARTSCQLEIGYEPSVPAAEAATVQVLDAAANSPQTAALTGTGLGQLPTGNYSFQATVEVGGTISDVGLNLNVP